MLDYILDTIAVYIYTTLIIFLVIYSFYEGSF